MMLFPMAGVCGVRVNVRWATSMTNSAAGAASRRTFTRLERNEPVTVVTSHGRRFGNSRKSPVAAATFIGSFIFQSIYDLLKNEERLRAKSRCIATLPVGEC